MKVSKVYNVSLLNIIAQREEITYDDLKEAYCEPSAPGVTSGKNVMFDSHLKTLESEGYIKIDDDIITYIGK